MPNLWHSSCVLRQPQSSKTPMKDATFRFWDKVDFVGPVSSSCPNLGPCWAWLGAKTDRGYGHLNIEGRNAGPHRFAYEFCIGPIPEGLVLDHLCRNRSCVEPFHIEPVTQQQNILRGTGRSACAARATHCAKGHPYDEVNTYWRRSGGRACRICRRQWTQNWRDRQMPRIAR